MSTETSPASPPFHPPAGPREIRCSSGIVSAAPTPERKSPFRQGWAYFAAVALAAIAGCDKPPHQPVNQPATTTSQPARTDSNGQSGAAPDAPPTVGQGLSLTLTGNKTYEIPTDMKFHCTLRNSTNEDIYVLLIPAQTNGNFTNFQLHIFDSHDEPIKYSFTGVPEHGTPVAELRTIKKHGSIEAEYEWNGLLSFEELKYVEAMKTPQEYSVSVTFWGIDPKDTPPDVILPANLPKNLYTGSTTSEKIHFNTVPRAELK